MIASPQDRQALWLAQNRPTASVPYSGPARTIAIASGKGGVGKTNIAVNLGLCLSQRGKRVLVFDADMGLANVDVILGLRVGRTLRDVVAGACQLKDILVETPGGIWLAPGGCGLAELINLDGFSRGRLLQQLADLESSFDFVLVDAAAGVGEDVVQFLRSVGEVLVVTTPEPTALTDAYALIKVAPAGGGVSHFAMVVNNARDAKDGQEAARRLQGVTERFLGLSVPLWGIVPFCDEVPAAVMQQRPALIAYPDSAFARAIAQIARQMLAQSGEPIRDRSGLSGALRGFLERLSSGRLAVAGKDA